MIRTTKTTVTALALAALMGAAGEEQASEPAEGEAKSLLKAMGKARKDAIRDEATKAARKALETKGIEPPDPDDPLPKIDGRTLDLGLEFNYRIPFMEIKVGRDIVTVRCGKRRWGYDFEKNAITEVK